MGLAFALSRAQAPAPALIAVLTSALLVFLLRGRIHRAAIDRATPLWKIALIDEPYYVHWCATLLSALLMLASLPVIAARRALGVVTPLSADIGVAAFATYAAAVALSAYGVFVRRRWLRVRTIDVSIDGLGERFDGYRIAQLSDLHIGGLWPRQRAERWARRVAALDVDLVVFTGDYVTSGTAFHADIAELLSSMRGRDGTLAVMGNHDYFGDGEPLITMLRERGVDVLRNEHRSITRGSDQVVIAGVDDTWTRRADVHRALAGRDEAQPLIALAHDPQLFPALARGGALLVLSGHTHWGQLALPFAPTRYNLSRLSYRYHAGLYQHGRATLYVHPGLGTTGPPIRIGAPPEITVLRLRRAT